MLNLCACTHIFFIIPAATSLHPCRDKKQKERKKLEGCRDGGVVSVKEVVEEEEEIKWQGSYEMCV